MRSQGGEGWRARGLRALAAGAAEFRAECGGAIAMMFAVVAIPVVLLVGAAIDFTSYLKVRAGLDAAADQAVLAAVSPSGLKMSQAEAEASIAKLFRDAAAAQAGITLGTVTVHAPTVNGARAASLTYAASLRTGMMQLAMIPSITFNGSATANSPDPIFLDFYLLLDNSPSMGVAATYGDIATMVTNTGDQCAFACHDLSANGNDYYALAKSLKVQMRIDVVRQATQQLMDTAAAKAVTPGQYRMAIYSFGTSCASVGLTQVSALTSNLATSKSDAAAIDLMSTPGQNYNNDQCTDLDGSLAKLNAAMPATGDGSSAASPQKVVFFVSDGVADAYYPSTCTKPTVSNGRCQEPITLAGCQALKDRGFRVAVLYTTYLPLPTNDWYNSFIAPFADQIPMNMQACASPGLFWPVSPSDGIADAMRNLFNKVVATQTRITH
ncbi:TadE/TadG family type IV pilus assembly protein [Methylobacterium sp. JK268]